MDIHTLHGVPGGCSDPELQGLHEDSIPDVPSCPTHRVSTAIKQLQDQLQTQPGFVPEEDVAQEDVAHDAKERAAAPDFDVRKMQLAIQLGNELPRRQEASMKAHLSAGRARPLAHDHFVFTAFVEDKSHVQQHADPLACLLREGKRSVPVSSIPKQFATLLGQRGCESEVEACWEEVKEDEVQGLLNLVRDAIPADAWDTTRILTMRQRDTLARVFRQAHGILGAPRLNLSPMSTCKCILALVRAGKAPFTDLQKAIESAGAQQSPSLLEVAPISPLVYALPVHGTSPAECRSSPYPTADHPHQAPKCSGKVSAVRKRQLEVLLNHARQRQRTELSFHQRVESSRPLREELLNNGVQLGVTPFHTVRHPCPVPFSNTSEPRPAGRTSELGTPFGTPFGTPIHTPLASMQRSDSPMSCDSDDSSGPLLLDTESRLSRRHRTVRLSTPLGLPEVKPGSLTPVPTVEPTTPLRDVLDSHSLLQYGPVLAKLGYDYASDLQGVTKEELVKTGLLPGHAQRLLNAVGQFVPLCVSQLPSPLASHHPHATLSPPLGTPSVLRYKP